MTTEDLARSGTSGEGEESETEEKVTQEETRGEGQEDRPLFPGEATDTEFGRAPESGGDDHGEPGSEEHRERQPLFAPEDEQELRSRWGEIQNDFVDDPREAVRAADGLVADLMQRLASSFADHKHGLEQQWNRGEEVQTEDLRLALQQYRSFFNRLLSS
ncbi:hypothetical protein [Streptomyces sp. FH025]|uniref:hypothetical protein n=1 Tax=Streptomyces sp. FH025 TaxID=2815937 RepID=UPI001A9FF694|nr:hypothetical protein [Streptomyces sp. FH025]MBO1413463.1 hypothetical protein [Streptomyces sp. FH025]